MARGRQSPTNIDQTAGSMGKMKEVKLAARRTGEKDKVKSTSALYLSCWLRVQSTSFEYNEPIVDDLVKSRYWDGFV